MRSSPTLTLIAACLLVLATSSFQYALDDEISSEYKPVSGRHDHCEDDYEYDESGCNADSQCEWDDDECDDRDDDLSLIHI